MTKDQIEYSLREKRLKLNFYGKFSYYSIVVFLLIIPLTLILFHLKDYFIGSDIRFKEGEFLFFSVPSILAFFFYKLQTSRLKFKMVKTKLSRDELKVIIKKVAKELDWYIYIRKGNYIEAKTFPPFLSGSWGEHITIIFDKETILINSICDLDKRSSVVSFGRNRENVNRLIQEINNGTYKSNDYGIRD